MKILSGVTGLGLAVALTASFAQAGIVTIAERPLVGPFATIQEGVNAALEGESLLVTPGNYAPFTITGKSVQVFVRGAGPAVITGKVSVKNLAPNQYVVLSRLNVTGAGGASLGEPALDILNVAGNLRVQDSTLRGQAITSSFYNGTFATGSGAHVVASVNVVFSACSIQGGDSTWNPGEWVIDGSAGIDSVNSSIALYGCQLEGGNGSSECIPRGGNGGAGYHGSSYGLFAAGTSFTGGVGGGGDYIGWNPGGIGGDALVIDVGQAHLLEDTYVAGPGGWPTFPAGGTVVAQNGSIVDSMPGAHRQISLSSITMDDANVPITITGQPGDNVLLVVARLPVFAFQKRMHGIALIASPFLSTTLPVGTIGVNGTLVVQRTFGIPDGTVSAKLFWLQALCVDAGGQATLTGPAHVLSLE